MKITVSRDEVLAWMAADPPHRGPTLAARHFGLKPATVKQWAKRARDEAGVAPQPRHRVTAELHVLPPPLPPPVSPVVITREAEEKPLPVDLHDLGVEVLRSVLTAMRDGAGKAKPGELAQILAAVGDRLPVLGDARKRGDTPTTAEPGTPEWLAEQVELAAALPPEVIAEAARRQKGA